MRPVTPEGISMTQHTHQTAPTQFAEANGIRFAYRRFGKPNGVPLVFNQHYTGTMDHWDPAVTDGFAKDREVILFNNAGVSSTSGEVPATFADMGANAIAFIKAPFRYVREHFGYRDRLTTPEIEGSGIEPTPGSGPPIKAGEFILGYPDEDGPPSNLPQPEILSRNGSYMAYRRLQQHVGAFRDFLREQGGPTADEQELLAAKLMGRWRSGAPLVLAPDKDDPLLADDPQRDNKFNYAKMDPQGYAVPLGAHIRRINPRDTAVNIQRRKMLRRGATYGPPLPEGAPEDGIDRGIAAFVICASLVRQFEFAQNVWVNDPNFHELGNERDPMIGAQDDTYSEAANPTKD